MKNDDVHDAAEGLRYVYVKTPKCPQCSSDRLRFYGKVDQKDSIRRYTQCRDCEHKFLVIST